MKKIGLLSDTHSFLDEAVFRHFEHCDEIWHAGDIGSLELADRLAAFKPLKAVYGNIDNAEIRAAHPLEQHFTCEGVSVWMIHIGGYPPNYTPKIRKKLDQLNPKLFICGHSHILKVISDKTRQLLHINPGAAGNHGFHKVKTLVRFDLDAGSIQNLEVIELGKRGATNV